MRRIHALLPLGLSLLFAGCGGGDSGGSNLPAPAAGKAAVGGKLESDGKALVRETVELQVGDKTRVKTKTDAAGKFLFTGVAPGTYKLHTDPAVKKGATSEITPGSKLACKAPGFHRPGEGKGEGGLVLGSSTLTSEGGTRYATFWPFVSESFEIKAGDRVVKDVKISCVFSEG